MIINLAQRIARHLLLNGTIEDEDVEVCAYGLFVVISYFLFLSIALLFGFFFNCIYESLVFMVSFHLIRKFAGGYHASTETKCEIMSTVSILICVVLIRWLKDYEYQIALLILTALSAVLIFLLCPLDTPEKPLSEKEILHFRNVSRIILIAISTVILISVIIQNTIVMYPTCISLILESILLITGKFKQFGLKKRNVR